MLELRRVGRFERELLRAAQESEQRREPIRRARLESARAVLALAMAGHPRMGANSPARRLPARIFLLIFEALLTTPVNNFE